MLDWRLGGSLLFTEQTLLLRELQERASSISSLFFSRARCIANIFKRVFSLLTKTDELQYTSERTSALREKSSLDGDRLVS
jgi:hypothetical protein